MTTPGGAGDLTIPDNLPAILFPKSVGGSSKALSSVANMNQGNVEDALKTAKVLNNPGITDPLTAMFAGLPAGMSYAFGIITTLAREILKLPGEIWDSIGDAASAVGGFVQDLWTGFGQLLDILAGAIVTPINAAIQAAKDWFAGLLGFRSNTETTQINLQNFQLTALTTGYRNPAYVFRYPIGDVSYMEVMNASYTTFGVTEAQSAGTAHTHAIDGNSVEAGPNVWSVEPGDARGALLTAQQTTVYDTVCFAARKDVSGDTLNNVFLEVFKMDASGAINRVFSTDVSAKITSTDTVFIEESIPGVIVQSGEQCLARVRNATTTSKRIYIGGIDQDAWVSDASAYFAGATEANKTSYSTSALAVDLAADSILPWMGLAAKNFAMTDRSWSDDFNRSALGGLWSCASDTGHQLGIAGNKLSFIGTTDGQQSGIQITAMAGDANMITGDIGLNPLGGSRAMGLLLHCDSTMDQVVYLAVTAANAKFYSGSISSLTQQAIDSTGGSGTWSAYYDVVNDKYVALKDGNPTGLEWDSVGSAVLHDADHRYGGARITGSTLIQAGQIDNITLRDWTP